MWVYDVCMKVLQEGTAGMKTEIEEKIEEKY